MNYFAYPSMVAWFMAPAVLWILAALLAYRRKRLLQELGSIETVTRLLPPGLARRRRWIAFTRIAGLAFWVLALVGPLLGAKLVEFKQKGLDVFIAVDCSLSMQAQDLQPDRMAHAKLILSQLIERLTGSRIGVIAFAGQSYVQCPLTIDTGAARQVLEGIEVGSVPTPGTAVGDAIRTALKGLKAGEGGQRVLVLLTDGEDHRSNPLDAAKEAANAGLKIFPIGIGTPQGEPIPLLDAQGHRTGYKRDKKGDVVMSRLDELTLAEIARITGGQYVRSTVTGAEIDTLVRALDGLQHGDQKTKMFNRYENRYQWPLALGLLLLLISLVVPERSWRKS
jgi:Ca-activated chloride channel family protein